MNNLTLVTALFDIKRGDLNPGFQRSFDHYIESFRSLLKTELPMVIYCDDEIEKVVWEERSHENTRIVKKTIEDLQQFPFYEHTNRIRQQEEWRNRSGWIVDSPQSQLELYNPLVMSKQFWLNDASIFNFFDTKYFLWIDAGISNTIGNPVEYFTEEFSNKLIRHMKKMMYICFPYDGNVEVHGFEKGEFNRWAGATTNRVARGGMFGGSADDIREINDIYYRLLNDTLNEGLMGTEESIFTLITYRHPELCNVVPIEANGLIITALNAIKNNTVPVQAERLAIYSLTYNSPRQFEMFVETLKEALPREFEQTKKYVLDNSTNQADRLEYSKLFYENGFEIVSDTELQVAKLAKDGDTNIGICGGRQAVAEHFAASTHEYMIFFEEDMLLHLPGSGPCKSGFTTHHQKLFDKSIDILEKEGLDYLKLCFSEFYGDNHFNWSWHNVPRDKQREYFPPRSDGVDAAAMKIDHTGTYRGLPYAVGEYYYCNWPVLFTKKANKKIFLDVRYAHLYEQTWMSHAHNMIRDGELKVGALLASPINHNRVYHYDGDTRRENEHYTN